MNTEVKEKAKEKIKKESVRRKKTVRKHNNSLEAIFGMLEGKIFCDDAVFNLGVKA